MCRNLFVDPYVVSIRNKLNNKASLRIATDFLYLLEQQFSTTKNSSIRLRHASQFAGRLNIHVNHLNRALKETLNKTTTQIISERTLEEAKLHLRTSGLRVAEIADVLGFTEATHFNNFFKKHMKISPTKFRAL